MNAQAATVQAFVITRTLQAQRDLVWKVWTNAEHLRHWFKPKGESREGEQEGV